MKTNLLQSCLLALFAASGLCSTITLTTSGCWTYEGQTSTKLVTTKSKSYSTTTTITTTVKATAVSTATTTSTTTITEQDTVTSTSTLPTHTDTATVTSQPTTDVTSTIGAPSTTTSTVTAVTTDLSGTITVPKPAGFTPAVSTLPSATADSGNLRRALLAKRAKSKKDQGKRHQTHEKKSASKQTTSSKIKGVCFANDTHFLGQKKCYPREVVCIKAIEVFVIQTKTQTVKTRTQTQTQVAMVTKTNTVTTTTTATPADTTITTTDTVTYTSTHYVIVLPATTTTTTTQTVDLPTNTAYAACQGDNRIGNIGGSSINGAEVHDQNVKQAQTDNSLSCCNSCFTDSTCSAFAFLEPTGVCYQITSDSCSTSNEQSFAVITDGDPPNSIFIVGNGQCGQFTSVEEAY